MEAIFQNRFEGSIFFVYDRHFLQKEEDRLEDAIIYFYPHSMPMDNQCRLCGQLMGVVQFTDSVFDSCPVLFRFNNEKVAVKHVGKYSFALAGSSVEPDSTLLATVDRLYFLFAFYHGSIDQVVLECDNDRERFIPEIRVIFEQYLAFIRNYGDNLPSVFNPIPYLPLKNDPNFYFLKASHILESCQRRAQIIAGSILYNRYILCSQLTDPISKCLLLLKPNQQHHPAMPIETDYQLPFGARLFNVYLKRCDLREILANNHDNSPYQSQSETLLSHHCCCSEHRVPRSRTPRLQRCIITPEPKAIIKVDEVLTRSEKDPLSSSGNSGPKLCKAMLEDLILKGFRCCKCIDETDGELENGSSFGNSIEEVMEDKCKPKNGFIYSTDDVRYNDLEEGREVRSRNSEHSGNSEHSRTNSQNSILETESGIEVTGSDFHSSAATHFDQRCASFRDRHTGYQEESQYFGKQGMGGCGLSAKTGQVKPGGYVERGKDFGLASTRNGERSDYNGIVDENEKSMKDVIDSRETENKGSMQAKYDNMLNKNVRMTSGDHDKISEQVNEKYFAQTGDVVCEGVVEKKQLSELSDNAANNCAVGKYTKQLNENQISDACEEKHAQGSKENCTDLVKESTKQCISDHQLNCNVDKSCEISVEKHSEEQREMSEHATVGVDTRDLLNVENDARKAEEMPHKLHNRNLDVGSDEQYQLSSSEDSYRTPDEILDTYDSSEESNGANGVNNMDINAELSESQVGVETPLDQTQGGVVHVRQPVEKDVESLGSIDEGECSKDEKQNKRHKKCCEVDGLIHANLFVQAHSEIVLILLAKCDLYQNEDAVRSLWSTSLSQLGELDILMKNSAKENQQDTSAPFNLLIYDNFEKTMSGNLREPVYAPDHVFCETAKTLHDHFNNAPHLCDVTLRNFLSGIYGERTLSREAYFHEPVNNTTSNLTSNVSGSLADRMRESIVKDHGLPFV
ncbi:Hypothetical predicted protein [Paramuricea clavata]|uniref:Uncharacterized protein n=1 Tax=Paramuricea clavata TaxID=317549 RepID=A0A7D9DJI1_PARCT|nr:Hypothetical predicted protein [Paramuricea clavata]